MVDRGSLVIAGPLISKTPRVLLFCLREIERRSRHESRGDVEHVGDGHTTSDVMLLSQDEGAGELAFRGTYFAGKETWGWRIALSLEESDSLRITHFNVLPSGEEVVAVEITCERTEP